MTAALSRNVPGTLSGALSVALSVVLLLGACAKAPPPATLAQARTALAQEHPREAAALLKSLIQAAPDDGAARALLAEALLDTGDIDEAQRQLAEANRLRAPRSALRVSECRVAAYTQTLSEALLACTPGLGETAAERAALYLQAGLAQVRAEHAAMALPDLAAALREQPGWFLAQREQALALAAAGDDMAADNALRVVFAQHADNAQAWHLRGRIEFLRGQFAPAARSFSKAAALAEQHGHHELNRLAREHGIQSTLLAGESTRALTAAAALLHADASSPMAMYLHAYALAANGQRVESRAQLETLLLKQPQLAQAKVLMGVVMLGLEQAGQANMYLSNALTQLPENALAQAALHALEQSPTAPAAAFKQVRRWIEQPGQDPQWLAWGSLLTLRAGPSLTPETQFATLLGSALETTQQQLLQQVVTQLQAHQDRAALATVEAATQRQPQQAGWRLLQSATRLATNDVAGSRHAAAAAAALAPGQVQVQLAVGRLLLATGDFPGAQSALQTALALPGGRAPAARALAELAQAQGDLKGSVPWLQVAVAANPKDAALLRWLVTTLETTGDRAGAVKALRTHLEQHGETAAVLSQYAWLLRNSAPEQAVSAMKRAMELERDLVEVLSTYGALLLDQGQPLEALPLLERAAKLAPRDARVHYQLACAYQRSNNRAAARDAISEALRGGHMFDERRAAETLATSLGAR